MVEGLARLATREKAAMTTLHSSYAYYVTAYRGLAVVLGTDAERLWRALWAYPTGRVRGAFVGVVDGLRRRAVGQAMTAGQRSRLRGLADQMFDSRRSGAAGPDQGTLERAWRAAF